MNSEDMGLIIERSPRSWYSDVLFELDLLRSYTASVEKQIIDSLNAFHREKETHIYEIDPQQGYADIVTMHHGLDDSTYHLEAIFEEYFPNLQRRSALITLFSFLEYQLDELCRLFANDQKLSVSLNDLKDKGIDRSYRYLKKVVGLPVDNSTSTWQNIKLIQGLRNEIVHNDGKLKSNEAIKYARDSDLLSGDDEVKIKEGYLAYVIKAFDEYFKEVNKHIPGKKRT